MSQNLYFNAKGMTKALPMHLINRPDFGSPHNKKKYPDRRRMLPIYLR